MKTYYIGVTEAPDSDPENRYLVDMNILWHLNEKLYIEIIRATYSKSKSAAIGSEISFSYGNINFTDAIVDIGSKVIDEVVILYIE